MFGFYNVYYFFFIEILHLYLLRKGFCILCCCIIKTFIECRRQKNIGRTTLPNNILQVDSRFTTTTQLVKLVGSHMISRLTLRIADLKRTKMVRTLNVFYNNRSVQAVVELKNKPGKKCFHFFLIFVHQHSFFSLFFPPLTYSYL